MLVVDFIGQLLNNLWFGLVVVLVALVVSAALFHNWQYWLRLWGAFLLMQVVVWTIKLFVVRPRPIGDHGIASPSFPSGVAADAGFVAAFLSLQYPKYSALWHSIGIAGALLRVYVDAHYVSDVVVGYLIGVLIVRTTQEAFCRPSMSIQ